MAAIYNYQTADTITSGLQGSKVCDEARQAARRMAAERGETVVLEDDDGNWAISPDGGAEKLPENWA
jgi:hypothetical protein